MDNLQIPDVREGFLVTHLIKLLPVNIDVVEISICAKDLLINIDACKKEAINKHKLLN